MSSPAICVFQGGDEFKFELCDFMFLTKTNKYQGIFLNGQIEGIKTIDFDNDMDRFNFISDKFMELLRQRQCKEAGLEDYSYGAAKGRVFNIAENTGILKHKLWKDRINYNPIPPKSVKKFATGNGNAPKTDMVKQFHEETGVDLLQVMNMEHVGNPVDDIVDAYFVAKYYAQEGLCQ